MAKMIKAEDGYWLNKYQVEGVAVVSNDTKNESWGVRAWIKGDFFFLKNGFTTKEDAQIWLDSEMEDWNW